MTTTNGTSSFTGAGFFEGVGRIFGSFATTYRSAFVSRVIARSPGDAFSAPWRKINTLLWASVRQFEQAHPEVKAALEHEQRKATSGATELANLCGGARETTS